MRRHLGSIFSTGFSQGLNNWTPNSSSLFLITLKSTTRLKLTKYYDDTIKYQDTIMHGTIQQDWIFYCHLYLQQAHSHLTSGNIKADPRKNVLKVQHIIVLTAKHIIDIQLSINDTKPFLSKETLTTESNQLRKVAEKSSHVGLSGWSRCKGDRIYPLQVKFWGKTISSQTSLRLDPK